MSSNPPIHADGDSAIAAAREIVPALLERAADTEERRAIPTQTIEDIRSAGLFRLCAPREFGGSQLGITAFVETTAEIASGCGSSGWVYGVLAGHNWTLSLLPLEAQKEVFSDPDALVASVIHLNSKPAVRVDGGYLIEEAHGRFCSGIDHAKWIIVGADILLDDNRREPHYVLIPQADFEITDDWFVVGLRGTGSKSVSAQRLFVPEHRVCSLAAAANGTSPGAAHHDVPLYRAPFRQMQRLQLLGTPIGIARGALRHCADLYGRHHGGPGRDQLDESRAAFLRIARASVELDAAANLALSDARALDALDGIDDYAEFDRARCLRDIAYAAQECRRIVSVLFEASGARGLLDDNALQRIWRDANAAAAHVAFTRDKVDLPYGRALCGLDEM